jgi:hypothetical protein
MSLILTPPRGPDPRQLLQSRGSINPSKLMTLKPDNLSGDIVEVKTHYLGISEFLSSVFFAVETRLNLPQTSNSFFKGVTNFVIGNRITKCF